jgi:hypothetical protein
MKQRGKCFERSGKAILSGVPGVIKVAFDLWEVRGELGGNWMLCHGVVTGTGGPVEGLAYAHAWLETECLVFDPDSVRIISKQFFYAAGNVRDIVRYTPEEARRMILLTEHWGPWADRFYDDDLAGPGDDYTLMRKSVLKGNNNQQKGGVR